MKKIVSVLMVAVALMMAAPAQAQLIKFGVKGGMNFSKLDTDAKILDDVMDNSTGFFIGPMMEVTLPLVIGAEPSVLPRYSVSMEKGEPTMVPMPEVKSVADALVSNRPGLKCFPVVRDHVDGFAAVDDTYMLKAMKMLLMEGKLLAEPSSCIGMGAVMQGRISVKPEDKVCFVISGGNLGFDQLELLGGVTY